MSESTIVHRIAKLAPKQQEIVEAFVAFLEQQSQAESTTAENPPPLKAGFLKGTFTVQDDFDEPLEDFKEYME